MHEEWSRQIEEFEKSGMKQREWCRQKGIPLGTFQYRLKRIRCKQFSKTFLEIKSKAPREIKLHWGQLSLELSAEFDMQTLERFLRVLQRIG